MKYFLPFLNVIFCFKVLLPEISFALDSIDESEVPWGESLCPCLKARDIVEINPIDLTDSTLASFNSGYNISEYGIGCYKHDLFTKNCSRLECAAESNIVPKNTDCDVSYCELSFCYVDPNNCELMNSRSLTFPNTYRFYSYATCHDIDSFTSSQKAASMKNRIFKVGFNSNSGGWQGAYSKSKAHFLGPVDLWSGPTVQFAIEGAIRGGFQINLTEPPEFLRNRSQVYFNSTSSFDFCVFAASLGYLDFCLAQYTISDIRAATTDWLVLGSQDLYLIVQYEEALSDWESFIESVQTIFSPFTPSVWIFVIFFVIPVLGMLMVVHEYGNPASSYAMTEDVIVKDNDSGIEIVETKHIPIYRHLVKALYINLLAVLQQNYAHAVVTTGAMLNLLGICFFILTLLAVYTANLAAILTQAVRKTSVSSLEDALKASYRICSERKNLETVRALYPEIQDSDIVLDPLDLGGDGSPGFNCPTCASRVRVFDFLDSKKASFDSKYCHAAFAPMEDLEIEQRNARHCNKTSVGPRVGAVQTGIPVNERRSSELISYFLKMKNDGVFDRELKSGQPQPNCPAFDEGGKEGVALNISQLTGIWIVSFGFAFAGLVVTFLQPKIKNSRKKTKKPVVLYDQNGNRINVMDHDSHWKESRSIMKGSKRVLRHESAWSKVEALKSKRRTPTNSWNKDKGSNYQNNSSVSEYSDYEDQTNLESVRVEKSVTFSHEEKSEINGDKSIKESGNGRVLDSGSDDEGDVDSWSIPIGNNSITA